LVDERKPQWVVGASSLATQQFGQIDCNLQAKPKQIKQQIENKIVRSIRRTEPSSLICGFSEVPCGLAANFVRLHKIAIDAPA
jgi:hypothetical protein